MWLAAGTRLGPYEIVAPLGAGGMGEVYRARDTKLGRDVAIKILPDAFVADTDRVARFQREAQLLATLNHPNIAAIYGLDETDGKTAIVLELVEGQTLAEKLDALRAKGSRLPLDEALPIARQIAEALESAHEKGVIHRDLKPANIKITAQGAVKVLDFGLAKMIEPGGTSGSAGLSMSPTLSVHATFAGVILGTAAYMSPEQARGRPVDKRTDIWAFGCVLFEMIAGRQIFDAGDTVSDAVAAILKTEPDWSALPADTPLRVRALLRRCLEKDPSRRLRDIGDARLELDDAVADQLPPSPVASAKRPSTSARLAWSIASVLGLALAGVAVTYVLMPRAAPAVVRFQILAPEGRFDTNIGNNGLNSGTVSPDGRKLAFVLTPKLQIWIRPIDSLTATPLAGSDGAAPDLFWSPDSRYVGFFTEGKLKKIDVGGGPPQTLCNVPGLGRGGAWNQDGTIVFGQVTGPLLQVSASGGEPSVAIKSPAAGDALWNPTFLPDGRHVLYRVMGSTPGMFVGTLGADGVSRVLNEDHHARYASGHLLYVKEGTLLAHPFNLSTLSTSGDPVPVVERVSYSGILGAYSASNNGVLAYRNAVSSGDDLQLTWVDRAGKSIATVGTAGSYYGVDLAADGVRIAVHRHMDQGGDVWVADSERGTMSRLTLDSSQDNVAPVWSPDGRRIAYASSRGGVWAIYTKASDGSGDEETLLDLQPQFPKLMKSWSSDGRYVLFSMSDPKGLTDLWVLPLFGDRKPFPFSQTPFAELFAEISPDGRWVAYHSTESGRSEVYVRPFPSGPGKWPVSTDGGVYPRWRRDGTELFYVNNVNPFGGSPLMSVPIQTSGSTFRAGIPKALFDTQLSPGLRHTGGPANVFAVAPDGQRFLMLKPAAGSAREPAPSTITVVLNWPALLKK
jgi:eukaryotic-like serine/threonine-protein kinase